MDEAGSASVPVAADGTPLRSLAPTYVEEYHGDYVRKLAAAVEDPSTRNIALMGAYGTGKSSILMKVAERYPRRALNLSLSTVGVDDDVPADPSGNPAAQTQTNRIQKEIVKQILYREVPERTRSSRFHRISRFRLGREFRVASIGGLLLLGVLYVTQLARPLVAYAESNVWTLTSAYGLLFAILAGIVLAVRWMMHGRFVLDTVTAGGASVKLTSGSSSYFDQYTDEIIYYFEQSGRDIVIFEDIDRFENVHIFETLRALNTLINGSDQVRQRRRPRPDGGHGSAPAVKFVYALRDSVFEKIESGSSGDSPVDAAELEMQRANRTKFFEQVVPVVPFITHRNARDLMSTEMAGTGVTAALIDVAARHVADKRLLVNMRNEYDVYAGKLLAGSSVMPGLDPDRLFALILYKNIHMADFEAIRFGRSQLDRLHDVWRLIVSSEISAARVRDRAAADSLTQAEMTAHRAQLLGDRLDEFARASVSNPQSGNYRFVANNQQRSVDDVRSPQFWTEYSKAATGISIQSNYGGGISLNPAQVRALLGDGVDATRWEPVDRQEQVEIRDQAREDIAFLRHHSWGEVYGQPRFTAVTTNGETESFAKAAGRLLGSQLACDLVAHGFINDYFALYISIYYGGHLRLDALNFIVHAIDQGEPDAHYHLDADDVEAILKEKGWWVLQDPAGYNISILDHLIAANATAAEMLVKHISRWDKDARDFAKIYVSDGQRPVEFIRLLTPLLPQAVDFVLNEAQVPHEDRTELVDAALANQSPKLEYTRTDGLEAFALGNYSSFDSLVSKEAAASEAEATIRALTAAGVKLPDVCPLNAAARAAVIVHSAYTITENNLQQLIEAGSVPLDALHGAKKEVYTYTLTRLEEYLSAIGNSVGTPYAISDAAFFATILIDADDAAGDGDQPILDELVERAAPGCAIPVLTDVPQRLWPALVSGRRSELSATNLLSYLDAFGKLDGPLGTLIAERDAIPEPSGVEEADRTRLALAIVNASQIIPSPAQRVSLALSLDPTRPFATAAITPERGQLVGLLIKEGLLTDEQQAFTKTLLLDWPTREYAIAASKQFSTFVSLAVLPVDDLAAFFNSSSVPDEAKDAVVAQLSTFTADPASNAGKHIAHYTARVKADLEMLEIQQLTSGGASVPDSICLMLVSTRVTADELRGFLRSQGGDYEALADPGTRKPLIDDTPVHRQLLEALTEAGVVSGAKPEKGRLRVSLRRS